MNLVIDTEKCNADNITIFKNSKHKTRIGYRDNKLLLNGLYLTINIKDLCIIYINHSYKCTFGYNKNRDVLGKLIQLEKDILSKHIIETTTKKPVYNICRQVVEYPGTISLSPVKRGLYQGVLVKIIGIWESDTEYGLIHYFYPINKKSSDSCSGSGSGNSYGMDSRFPYHSRYSPHAYHPPHSSFYRGPEICT
jgi:hypothetical protein